MATVAVDVTDLCALDQTMQVVVELLHGPPADVDPHASVMAARGLLAAMLRRLADLEMGR